MTTLKPHPVSGSPALDARLLPQDDPITQLPIVILAPHSRCNCRCLMCDIWRATDRKELTVAQVDRWRVEWRRLGVRRVVLTGGEALLHSDLIGLMDVLRDAGVGITLLTTGLLLKRHASIVAEYCDDIVVSLDGPREVHNMIRNIPHVFEKLAEGVSAVRAVNADVSITGRCTVQRANFRFLRATVAAAHEIALGRISFLAADVSSEAFNRPGGWEPGRVADVALRPEDLPLLRAEIGLMSAECYEDFVGGFIAESPQKLRRRLMRYFGAIAGVDDFSPVTCNAPWVSTVIEPDGQVRPCFFHPPIGNIHEAESLGAVLNSPRARAFRAQLDTLTDPICKSCVCSLALYDGDCHPDGAASRPSVRS